MIFVLDVVALTWGIACQEHGAGAGQPPARGSVCRVGRPRMSVLEAPAGFLSFATSTASAFIAFLPSLALLAAAVFDAGRRGVAAKTQTQPLGEHQSL